MAFQKDNFEDDNELSRLEDDEELGGEDESRTKKEGQEIEAQEKRGQGQESSEKEKETVSLSYSRESFSAKGPGARFRLFLFWRMPASRMESRQRSPASQLEQRLLDSGIRRAEKRGTCRKRQLSLA